MADFENEDLSSSTFSRVRLAGSDFSRVEFTNAHFWEVDLSGSRFDSVGLQGVQVWGEIDGLSINGVSVAPLVDAELTRLYPEYAGLKPVDAQGYRDSWERLQQVWATTLARAETLDPALLTAHVGAEWSFIQTVRHLSFAITSWLDGAIGGDPSPWEPLDLPWDQMPPHPDVPWDKTTDVDLAQARELYDASAARLTAYLGQLTDDQLDRPAKGSPNPNWPDERPEVAEALQVIFNEAFWYHRFAVRDLDQLDN
ncbi:DinB family protein [Branchiibius sp. NY16-3462-2]|uniref:DinB family protein n=1 Tax=Branchiibius sp. NY16-3462-2 TaxID=1807500 RepID=UPI00079BEF37|nr:DinB family protein [Branchiibius sp. NY16-3462-2]KYH46055.1 hypothetical protein AZH51_10425 [Branchiibius sp. NY16-3462-2]